MPRLDPGRNGGAGTAAGVLDKATEEAAGGREPVWRAEERNAMLVFSFVPQLHLH